jgi:hypothetical protein
MEPWLSARRAAHGQIASLDALTELPIEANQGLRRARALFFTNTGSEVKVVFWIDAENRERPLTFSKRTVGFSAFRTKSADWSISAATFDSLPDGLSDRWVIRDAQGVQVTEVDLARNPNAALLIDLPAQALHVVEVENSNQSFDNSLQLTQQWSRATC